MKQKTIFEHIKKEIVQFSYDVKTNEKLTVVVFIGDEKNHTIHLSVHLNGKLSQANILGIVYGSGNSVVKFHTLQHHGAPETTSNLLVKGVLTGSSTLHYEGGIVVDPIAQKTDAYQRNENLLMNSNTHATSKPALEILANDVRCTHGATISTINPEHLWYLGSRGIEKNLARNMISDGFLRSMFLLITDVQIRETVEKKLNTVYKEIYG
jgi:Fe-S cluster assembly protein SufD